ncbi:HdeA/HdeB family chaperone [Paraburkholderia sp. J11-2]|uniref:HdeA/HdeB family chaperone n=1 Tax=Paraburkholderia sp. J11-2 TaxID=2805431 RepID=UPI002AB60AB2|nr:HdeA/HdeB family chaperone [Paraburkholderia sp. J11-2]
MSKIVAAAVAVFAMSGAFAQDAVVVGLGAQDSSCGDWIKARREQNKLYQLSAVLWVQGFLSGMNTARKADQMINLPASSVIEAMLDNECANSPTGPLFSQSLVMYGKLRIEQGKKPDLLR